MGHSMASTNVYGIIPDERSTLVALSPSDKTTKDRSFYAFAMQRSLLWNRVVEKLRKVQVLCKYTYYFAFINERKKILKKRNNKRI